jgi:hypothetical protein
MNIKVSDLKKFQKYAANIKTNKILPIYGYLKFGDGTIVKNISTSFVVFDCEDAKESVLVDEHLLNSLLNVTTSEFINISIKGNKVTISDTRDKIVFQAPAVKEYSALPKMGSDKMQVSDGFIEALGMSANFAVNMADIPEKYMYVHIGEKTICAGDGIIGFHCPVEESMKIVLEKKIAQLLCKYNISAFSQSDSYYFFYTPEAVLGFAIQSIGWMDIRRVFADIPKVTFTTMSSDIQSFNALSMQASASCIVTMETGKLEMNDMLSDIKHDRPAENLVLPEPFTYAPSKMNTVLSALGSEEIDFHEGKGMYYIKSSDTKATAIIAKINKA